VRVGRTRRDVKVRRTGFVHTDFLQPTVYAADKLWTKIQDPKEAEWSRENWNRYKQGLLESQTRVRN